MESLKVKETSKGVEKKKKSVFMDKICSMEYYKKKDGSIKRVLTDIDFKAELSDTYVVTGDSLFDIKLLLEIMANTKPYQKGKCILVETGMMRQKRIILNHTFYIGNINMPFNNMKVLEYLMLVTGKRKGKAIERQAMILELLIKLDLSYIALSEINLLKDEEKSIVTLLVSAISNSELIVFNIPMLNFNEKQKEALRKITKYISEVNKTLIFSTMDKTLADEICEKILVLDEGKVIYDGVKEEFIKEYDKVIFRVYSKENEKLLRYLKKENKNFSYKLRDSYIEVFDYKENIDKRRAIYNEVLESGIEILR
ncbi:MAG: hypothetical protein ACRCX8_16235, partial [Sarcina sp.]